MKIRDPYSGSIVGVGNVRRKRGPGAPERVSGVGAAVDPIEISARSHELRRARNLALNAPEIREGFVEALTAEIERGEYRVPGAEVASRMIQDHLAFARV